MPEPGKGDEGRKQKAEVKTLRRDRCAFVLPSSAFFLLPYLERHLAPFLLEVYTDFIEQFPAHEYRRLEMDGERDRVR